MVDKDFLRVTLVGDDSRMEAQRVFSIGYRLGVEKDFLHVTFVCEDSRMKAHKYGAHIVLF